VQGPDHPTKSEDGANSRRVPVLHSEIRQIFEPECALEPRAVPECALEAVLAEDRVPASFARPDPRRASGAFASAAI